MELVSLDSREEANRFLRLARRKASWFELFTHVGAITLEGGNRYEYFWVNSGNRINYPLRFAPGQPDNFWGNEHCLGLIKYGDEFFFNDFPCAEKKAKFICQLTNNNATVAVNATTFY